MRGPGAPLWVILMLISTSTAYQLRYNSTGSDLLPLFNAFQNLDPTNGYVKYVSKDVAESMGLVRNVGKSLYIGVDHTHKAAAPGRKSVRLESKDPITKNTLVILDLQHMPAGQCGTWPAFWTYNDDWPAQGEIDVIEGVNKQQTNRMTIHSGSDYKISREGFSGQVESDNCNVYAAGQGTNQGCVIVDQSNQSFGHAFNTNGGGVFAMEWTEKKIKMWFFPRHAIPHHISSASPLPSQWGSPRAVFAGEKPISDILGPQKIVFNIAFCGDWAGQDWTQCASVSSTCEEFVANNPNAFRDTYWLINSLAVYTKSNSEGTVDGSHTDCGF